LALPHLGSSSRWEYRGRLTGGRNYSSRGNESGREVADELHAQGIRAPRGDTWHPTAVARLLARLSPSERTQVRIGHLVSVASRLGSFLRETYGAGFSPPVASKLTTSLRAAVELKRAACSPQGNEARRHSDTRRLRLSHRIGSHTAQLGTLRDRCL
jgi:hypothetical protein